MTLKEHCAECLRILGNEYREVHVWLDEFAGHPTYNMRHRRLRLHEAGIKETVTLRG